MSRFETVMLSSGENLTALMNLSGTWIDSVHDCAPLDKLILDLDSSVSPTERYHSYRDPSRSKAIMGEAIREAYEEVFHINETPGDKDRGAIKAGSATAIRRRLRTTRDSIPPTTFKGQGPKT